MKNQSVMPTNITFNPFSAEYKKNPYAIYARLREKEPVHWSLMNAWVITLYEDIDMIFKDSRFVAHNLTLHLEQKNVYFQQNDLNPLMKVIQPWLFFIEPPDHTRLRSLVTKAFSFKTINSFSPKIETIVNELLEKIENYVEIDFIKDFARILPASITCEILGLPKKDLNKLMYWSENLFSVFEQPKSLNQLQHENQLAIEITEYLTKIIKDKEKNPQKDLISHLISARDEHHKLSQDEIIGFCVVLLITGQETTKGSIGNSIAALLKNRDKFEELKNNPHLIKKAVPELLRYDTSIPIVTRIAKENLEIRGKQIKKDDKLILCLASANRDSNQYSQPDVLNFHRDQSNLAFGGGIHLCIGHILAKMQMEIALNNLIEKFPKMKLNTTNLQWRNTTIYRGLESLPILL